MKVLIVCLLSVFVFGCGDSQKIRLLEEMKSLEQEATQLAALYDSDSSISARYDLLDEYRDIALRIIELKKTIRSQYTGKERLDFGFYDLDSKIEHRLDGVESIEYKNNLKGCYKTCEKKYQPCWAECGCVDDYKPTHIRWTTHTYGSNSPLRGLSLTEYPDICHGTQARKCRSTNCLTFRGFEQCHIDCQIESRKMSYVLTSEFMKNR